MKRIIVAVMCLIALAWAAVCAERAKDAPAEPEVESLGLPGEAGPPIGYVDSLDRTVLDPKGSEE